MFADSSDLPPFLTKQPFSESSLDTTEQETTYNPTQGIHKKNFIWLLRLRWAIVAIQTVLVLVGVQIFHVEKSFWLITLVISLGLTSNIFFYGFLQRKKNIPCHLPTMIMFFDVILMTALFFQTISTLNPATILFIIYIVLGALLLDRKCSYLLTAFTIACYTLFFHFGEPMILEKNLLPNYQHFFTDQTNSEMMIFINGYMSEHLASFKYFMLLVFFLISVLIVYPVGKMKEEMEIQQVSQLELEEAKIRTDKLAALATFAAGAAHEFSTPLSTIAMASGEMMYFFKQHGGPQELIDDTRLIREQVSRCKEILFQMSAKGGKHMGEEVDKFNITELVHEAMALFSFENIQQINFVNQVGDLQIVMPPRTLTRTLRGLLKNAMDASEDGTPIDLICRKDDQFLYFEVKDKGLGMDEEFLKRATEPFFTSKQPGKGMGLGLYLTNILASRFGGEFKLFSKKGEGTTAILSFALKKIQAKAKPPR